MPAKSRFDARKMMKKAIEVMRKSVNEPRSDGKASPLVGAVLVKSDGSIETAWRGELRDGDHAEFALLERKNRAVPLDGSKLFVTLEPCAPGSRQHPKLGCAERIVLARIKEVWVGLEDPDPTVDRKGIKHLQDHGVTVEMFDRDLQEDIREANRDFIAQALDRKAAAEKDAATPVTLSTLEDPVSTADLSDFDGEVLERFRTLTGMKEPVGSEPFLRRLVQQGLLQVEGRKFIPAGFGMLLFGKSPRDIKPQAGLLATIHYPNASTEDVRDFDGPMVLIPEQAIQWLKDKLPNPINRSGAQRKEALQKFYELLREGIVNALVHRNYDLAGAKCQLVVTPDTIVIKSPGGPIEPITLQQLQKFNAPMLSRNPVLHYVFAKMELAEERGLGLKSMESRASEIGLPLPTYTWEDPYLVLTLYRHAESATRTLDSSILDQLTAEEQKGWTFLSGRAGITQSEYKRHMGVTPRTAQRHLGHFVKLGLLRRVGRGPATEYLRV
ncbi:MAG: ATP-binding protein [Chthoniobacterales bacterium]